MRSGECGVEDVVDEHVETLRATSPWAGPHSDERRPERSGALSEVEVWGVRSAATILRSARQRWYIRKSKRDPLCVTTRHIFGSSLNARTGPSRGSAPV